MFLSHKKIKQLEARVLELEAQNAELARRCKNREIQLERADEIIVEQAEVIAALENTMPEPQRPAEPQLLAWLQKYSPSCDAASLN
jgi:hypothetical protein